ncbi:hypothetical protein J103_08120 [Burkholderia pseudomallei MSHR5855]|nr:hypothetical protein J103_08120 [Burkholderia pseudomallei MSHR5855]
MHFTQQLRDLRRGRVSETTPIQARLPGLEEGVFKEVHQGRVSSAVSEHNQVTIDDFVHKCLGKLMLLSLEFFAGVLQRVISVVAMQRRYSKFTVDMRA